jgi:hypothetical protein
MRIEYLAAIAIAAFAVGTGLAVHSVGSLPPEEQPTPAVALVDLSSHTPSGGGLRADPVQKHDPGERISRE